MASKGFKVAVVGATGLVGREMISVLEERGFPVEQLIPMASTNTAGSRVEFEGREHVVKLAVPDNLDGAQIVLMSAGGGPSKELSPLFAEAGAVVIDNSSTWRMDEDVPLVVPEVNPEDIAGYKTRGIIANPNCSTIQIAMAVAPLDEAFTVQEAHVTTLQAVSGAGQAAVTELENQEKGIPTIVGGVFPRTIARNAIPAIGAALSDGSFEEETKVVRELRKILGRGEDLAVTCTATRVPVVTGHSAAVRLVCKKPIDLKLAAAALEKMPGVEVDSDPHGFATPLEAAGGCAVHVGRLRADQDNPHALLMWVVADNLLKGAAWNAVQIAGLLAGKLPR